MVEYDQGKPSQKYVDLLTFTDTYKLLFIPWVRMHEPSLNVLLFGTGVSKGLVNVYPTWEEEDTEGLYTNHVYLVFRNEELEGYEREWRDFITSDYIEQKWIRSPEPNNPNNPIKYTIAKVKLPENIVDRFLTGSYSQMFDNTFIKNDYAAYETRDKGIVTTVCKKPVVTKRLSKEYHILLRSELYEKVLAAKLEIPWEEFKGRLHELKSPIDLTNERLRITLLHNQIEADA